MILAAGSMIGFFTLGYMANAYFMGYAHTHVGFSPDLILAVGLLGGVVVAGVQRAEFRAERHVRSPSRHHRGVGGWRSVGVRRAPADRHGQCRVVHLGDDGHLRGSPQLVRADGGVHPGDLRDAVPPTPARACRSTSRASSVARCRRSPRRHCRPSWGVGSIGLMMAAVVLTGCTPMVCTARPPEPGVHAVGIT